MRQTATRLQDPTFRTRRGYTVVSARSRRAFEADWLPRIGPRATSVLYWQHRCQVRPFVAGVILVAISGLLPTAFGHSGLVDLLAPTMFWLGVATIVLGVWAAVFLLLRSRSRAEAYRGFAPWRGPPLHSADAFDRWMRSRGHEPLAREG